MSEQSPTKELSKLEQAALLLLSMGEESAASVMSFLDRNDVEHLSYKMAGLSSVTQQQAEEIMNLFFERYQQQAGIAKASRNYLQKTLDLALGDRVAKNLIDSIYGDEIKTLIKRLEWVDPKLLAQELFNEHVQLQAVMLGLLPPETAAHILNMLPTVDQDEIMVRIAQLGDLEKEVVDELKQLIERCMLISREKSSTQVAGVKQVANILNRYDGNREQLLRNIKIYDPKLANDVKDSMFNFMILGRQKPEVLSDVISAVDMETLALALKGVDNRLKTSILSALPRRQSSVIEAQMGVMGGVPISQANEARKKIMQRAREMMEREEIELQLFEEQEVV